MDLIQIRELVKIMDESGLTAFELEEEGLKIVLKKEIEKIALREFAPSPAAGGQVFQGNQTPVQGDVIESEKPSAQLPTIKSPIVGTFYSAPSPGEEPFVRPGSDVKKGDVLCIIEAMKLMNEIEADEDIHIIDILVDDGQMVEYGQPLFVVSAK
ncbi:MAG: Biotin carboxyl carrier protein of acetyl-CoA carboxylase [Candidatus Dichloromethanomonas elyunquensis]|nr:MAG: Biotin carboxyl carrier protein of acetyl-CoA carboxylase [Candidatus Dichloromethanomonas elyunquensis]